LYTPDGVVDNKWICYDLTAVYTQQCNSLIESLDITLSCMSSVRVQ
jgi:hypothetical protein